VKKGGATHTYQSSWEGAQAIQGYLRHERAQDAARWPSPALFLTAATVPQGMGRLTVGVQLGHRQAAYAMQYARTTTEELA